MADPLLEVPDPLDRRTDAGEEFAVVREGAGLYTSWTADPAKVVPVLDRVRISDPGGTYRLVARTVTEAVPVPGW